MPARPSAKSRTEPAPATLTSWKLPDAKPSIGAPICAPASGGSNVVSCVTGSV